MTVLKIDLRFVEYNYELYTLSDYISFVEDAIVNELKKREVEIDNKIKKYDLSYNDPEYSLLSQDKYKLREYFLPKFFINPIVVSLWAIIETALTFVAEYVRNSNNLELKLNDIRGENFLDRCQKYYKHILNFPILSDKKIYEIFYIVMKIRHLIAHCNGHLVNLKSEKDSRFSQNLLKQNKNISLYSDEIIITQKFISQVFEVVKKELELIFETVKNQYENNN